MMSLMASPEDILNGEFLRSPLFPVALLRDVATLYDFSDVPDGLVTALELSPLEASNRSIMTHAWFALFLDCSHDTIRAAIDTYHRSRGSPNLFTRAREANNLAQVDHGTQGANQANPLAATADNGTGQNANPFRLQLQSATPRGNGTSQRLANQSPSVAPGGNGVPPNDNPPDGAQASEAVHGQAHM